MADADKRDEARRTLQAKMPEKDKSAKVSKKKKDTKKWCKGKEGVEHKKKCVDYAETQGCYGPSWPWYEGWKVLLCVECGKRFATYHPWPATYRIGIPRPPPPDWVT